MSDSQRDARGDSAPEKWNAGVDSDATQHDPLGHEAAAEHRSFVILTVAGLAGLIAVPFVVGDYYVSLATEILIFAILVSGVNLLLGYTGLISLGNAAFLGIGGYCTAVVASLLGFPVWLAMLGSVVASLLIAYLVGLLCVRTKSVQFLLITLAVGEMFHAVAEKTRYTGGDDGLTGIPRLDLSFLGFDTDNDLVFYFVVLICFVIALAIIRRVVDSPFGRVLVGIRENEKRMQAMGYTTYPYKALAFGISGMLGGLAGSLWVQHAFFINPQLMTWEMSGEALLMVIIGGSQAFYGPLLGAAFYVLAKDFLSGITDAYILFFGLLFVVVVAFFHGGLAGLITNIVAKMKGRRPHEGSDR